MKTALSLLLILTLSSCATWTKPGATSDDLAVDKADCTIKANEAGIVSQQDNPGTAFASNYNRSSFIKSCLFSKGWDKSFGL